MIWERSAATPSSASPQAVWDVLLDGRRWSFWNPGVEWMWIEGDPIPGTLVTIKLKRVRQTAFVIEELVAPQRFALRLTVGPVARMRLTWTLHSTPSGTRIEAAVAIEGVAARLLLQRSAERLAQALPASLERLAERAGEAPEIEKTRGPQGAA